MAKNYNWLIGVAEIGAGLLILPPSPEDIPTAGATIPLTGMAGLALIYDGLKRF